MQIEFDAAKREWTLRERGLDFADAGQLMDGLKITLEDDRQAYPEPRFQTYGFLGERMVMIAWTPIPRGHPGHFHEALQ